MAWSKKRWDAVVASTPQRKSRLPRQAEPIGLMNTYAARINRMRADMIASIREHVVPSLEAIAASASRIALDAKNKSLGEGIDAARAAFDKKWNRAAMTAIVEPIAKDVPKFQAGQLNKQLSSAIGSTISLDIVGSEAWVANAAAEWTAENVALIKSIPDTFYPDLEKYLTSEVADGARFEELAATLEDRYDITASRARLIARDQIGKFNGDLNRVRQQDLGISKFVWRTMGDERVRDDATAGPGEGHVERNGKEFTWDDPPEGETPGEPVCCRCYAEPAIQRDES